VFEFPLDKRRCCSQIRLLNCESLTGESSPKNKKKRRAEEKFLTYWIASYWTENVRKMILSFPSGESFRLLACSVPFSGQQYHNFAERNWSRCSCLKLMMRNELFCFEGFRCEGF
jgi:hypothetical protein